MMKDEGGHWDVNDHLMTERTSAIKRKLSLKDNKTSASLRLCGRNKGKDDLAFKSVKSVTEFFLLFSS